MPTLTLTPGKPADVRLDYADSTFGQGGTRCGGSCSVPQLMWLVTKIKVNAPVTLTINITGNIEHYSAGFDTCTVFVNDVQRARIESVGDFEPCETIPASDSGSVVLPEGCHTIEIRSSTGDALHHVGMFHNVEFVFSDETVVESCESELCNGFDCNSNVGCLMSLSSTPTFKTLALCQASCQQRWGCTPSGCAVFYATSGFESEAACQEQCLERFVCSDNGQLCDAARYSCTAVGYSLTGQTLTQCQTNCVPKSWVCHSSCGCGPLNDTSGEFATLTACSNLCELRYECDPVSGCVISPSGWATSGMNAAACAQTCVIQSYECDPTNRCVGRFDASGQYSTAPDCEAACQETYACSYFYETEQFVCAFQGYSSSPTSYNDCCAFTPCATLSPPCNNQIKMSPEEVTALRMEMLQTMAPQTQQLETKNFEITEQIELTPAGAPGTIETTVAPPTDATSVEFVRTPIPDPVRLPSERVLTLEEQDPTGPGTFLAKTLEKIGIKTTPTCSCKARARTMNEKGNDWCEENLDTIVDWLREEATKRKLPFVDLAGKLLVKRAIKLSRAAKAKALQECDEPNPPPAANS